MKLRWKHEGADWLIQASGPLRWGPSGPDPITRLRDQAARFLAAGEGFAILDLTHVTEADPRNVVELFDVFRELRVKQRMRLRGRTSPVASAIAPAGVPWIDAAVETPPTTVRPPSEQAATIAPIGGEGNAQSNSPEPRASETPRTPPTGQSWSQLVDSLPESQGDAGTVWRNAAEKIEQMVSDIEDPDDERTESFLATDRDPTAPVEDATKGEGGVPRRSTEQLSAPLLWFDEGLEEVIPPTQESSNKGRKTVRKPVPGVKSTDRRPPPGQDVFEWFFSMGEAAVRHDEEVRRVERESAAVPREPKEPKGTQGSVPAHSSSPPASAVGPAESVETGFGFPEIDPADLPSPPPAAVAKPGSLRVDGDVARRVAPSEVERRTPAETEIAPPAAAQSDRASETKPSTPSRPMPSSIPRDLPEFVPVGEESECFEAFGFPSLEEVDRSGSTALFENIASKGTKGAPTPANPAPADSATEDRNEPSVTPGSTRARPAGFEKFPTYAGAGTAKPAASPETPHASRQGAELPAPSGQKTDAPEVTGKSTVERPAVASSETPRTPPKIGRTIVDRPGSSVLGTPLPKEEPEAEERSAVVAASTPPIVPTPATVVPATAPPPPEAETAAVDAIAAFADGDPPPAAEEAPVAATTNEETPSPAVVREATHAGVAASSVESEPDLCAEGEFEDDFDDDETFPLFGNPLEEDDADDAAMLAPEVEREERIEDSEEADDDFVIDLELEEMYLTRSPNSRDKVHDSSTVEFKKGWSALERGDEVVAPTPAPTRERPDPVSLLLGGGDGADTAAAHEPAPIAASEPASASPAPRTDSSPVPATPTPRERVQEAAQPFLEFLPGGSQAGSRPSNRTDAMMRAIARLLGDYESVDQERADFEAQVAEMRRALEAKETELSSLKRAVHAMRATGDGTGGETPEAWMNTLLASPSNPDQLRARYTGSINRFRASGAVDPERVLTDITELDRRAPRIAAGVGAVLERGSGTPGDGWRALLLVLSTLVREGASPARRRRGLRVAWLASLLRNAPGSDGADLDFVGPAVGRLLSGRTYRFPAEEQIDPDELRADLELWHAATRLDLHRRLTPKRWRGVIGRTLAKYEEEDEVRSGLARLVEAHSLYFPGVWVELTTGGIGPVLGANPGRPEFPRVLVLFRRDGMRAVRTPPQITPTGVDATAGVLRILSQPHVAEKDGNTLAIDTGGSVVVPKKK